MMLKVEIPAGLLSRPCKNPEVLANGGFSRKFVPRNPREIKMMAIET
jgi:hypothetical protein